MCTHESRRAIIQICFGAPFMAMCVDEFIYYSPSARVICGPRRSKKLFIIFIPLDGQWEKHRKRNKSNQIFVMIGWLSSKIYIFINDYLCRVRKAARNRIKKTIEMSISWEKNLFLLISWWLINRLIFAVAGIQIRRKNINWINEQNRWSSVCKIRH